MVYIATKIKSNIKKSAKILGYSASVLALGSVAVLAPVLAVPSILGMCYSLQAGSCHMAAETAKLTQYTGKGV